MPEIGESNWVWKLKWNFISSQDFPSDFFNYDMNIFQKTEVKTIIYIIFICSLIVLQVIDVIAICYTQSVFLLPMMGEYILLEIFISDSLSIKCKIFSNDIIIIKSGTEILEEVECEMKDLDNDWVWII